MSHAPHIPAPRAPQLTHFLGLSLVTPASRPQLQAALEAFRDTAKNDKELNIPEAVAKHAIRPVDTLHLTLCTFSLSDKEPEKLQEVISHLKEIDLKKLWHEAYASKHQQNVSSGDSTQSSQSQNETSSKAPLTSQALDAHDSQSHQPDNIPPLRVTLKGISTMRSPSSTTVVYAPPEDETGTLQSFCESIRGDFKSYLPKAVTQQEPIPAPSVTQARPALESFPHPGSYKSHISITSEPAPPTSLSSLERPVSPPPALSHPSSPPSAPSTSDSHLSHRQQKRLTKQARGELPHLILHATLLNTIYIRGRGRKSKPITIDARPLVERFQDMIWMENVEIGKLCLYKMGAKEVLDENGNKTGVVRYTAEAEREMDLR